MKRILITGLHSYIGNAVEAYLKEYNEKSGGEAYRTEKISLRGEAWKQADFGAFDTVFHVAGIAHADVKKATAEEQERYYAVNCDLAWEAACKAKAEGVGQFIYMSSVIVYGDSAGKISEEADTEPKKSGKAVKGGVLPRKHITKDTPPAPSNFYGDSKWRAEQRLGELAAEGFRVAVVRSPMVYGKGSKGNYPLLCKLAGMTPVFPKIANERSMIYMENLAEFLRLLAETGEGGVYLPQNETYANTCEMVKLIREKQGKKMYLWKIGNPLVYLAAMMPGRVGGLVKKAFGTLTIEQALSNEKITGYQLYSLEESIRRINEG